MAVHEFILTMDSVSVASLVTTVVAINLVAFFMESLGLRPNSSGWGPFMQTSIVANLKSQYIYLSIISLQINRCRLLSFKIEFLLFRKRTSEVGKLFLAKIAQVL